jgi:hypothetical protein
VELEGAAYITLAVLNILGMIPHIILALVGADAITLAVAVVKLIKSLLPADALTSRLGDGHDYYRL